MTDRWYYTADKKTRLGPVSADELRDLLRSGALGPAPMVLKEGERAWTTAEAVTGRTEPTPVRESPPIPTGLRPEDGRWPRRTLALWTSGACCLLVLTVLLATRKTGESPPAGPPPNRESEPLARGATEEGKTLQPEKEKEQAVNPPAPEQKPDQDLKAPTPPGPTPPTPEQQEKIKEAGRLRAEVVRLFKAGKLDEAVPVAEQLTALTRAIHGEVHADVAATLRLQAEVHEARQDFAAARKCRAESLALHERLHGKGDWRTTDARLALENADLLGKLSAEQRRQVAEAARLLQDSFRSRGKGDFVEAVARARKALEMQQQVLGDSHPDCAASMHSLASLYREQGDHARAEALYRQLLELRKSMLGEKHPHYAHTQNSLALLYQAREDYARAEPLFRHALEVRKQTLGEKHADTAASLTGLAGLYAEQGDYLRAEPLFEQALEIQRQARGARHPDTLAALGNLHLIRQKLEAALADPPDPAPSRLTAEQKAGRKQLDRLWIAMDLARQAGEFDEAAAAAEKLVALQRRVFGDLHRDTVVYLAELGAARENLRDFAAARTARAEALALRERLDGEGHWRTTTARLALEHTDVLARMTEEQLRQMVEAVRLAREAVRLHNAGRYAEAVGFAEKATAGFRESLGERHPEYVHSLSNLANVLVSRGEYSRAEPLLREALACRKRLVGEGHPDYARSLGALAGLHRVRGDYAEAEALYQRSLEIRRRTLGEKHPETVNALSNLASAVQDRGDYARAERAFRQVLELRKQAPGEKHADYALTLNNLGVVYEAQKDFVRAEAFYGQAADILREAVGAAHPSYANALNNLAHVCDEQNDPARAEPLYLRVLKLRKEALGEKHPDYAATLNHLGMLYLYKHDYDRAAPLLRQSLELRKEVLGADHPACAESLNNLGVFYVLTGDYARAAPVYQETLALMRRGAGEADPRYSATLNSLALLALFRGDAAEARRLLALALRGARAAMELASAGQSERQQLAAVREQRFYLDTFLSTAGAAPAEYEFVLAWKGNVLARQRWQRLARAVLQERSAEAAKHFADLEKVSGCLAALALSGSAASSPGRVKEMAFLTDEKERLEKDLARLSAAFRGEKKQESLTADGLGQALPEGAVLVDFLDYWHLRPDAREKGGAAFEHRLLAFVVRRGRAVARLDLGPVAPLTAAIDRWRLTIRRGRPNDGADDPGAELRRRVWAPLEEHLKGAAVVLLSPDGALNRLPFAALPGKGPGTFLLEDVAVAVVPVPQLLPELLAATPADPAAKPSLLLVGDVDFGAAPGAGGDAVASRSAVRGAGGKRIEWQRLPGTKAELEAIRALYAGRFGAAPATLTGAGATEAAVKAGAVRSRWLHLATHGFFAPPSVRSALAPDPKRGAGLAPGQDLFGTGGVAGFHPGLLSGLVLAGANRVPEPEQDDGVLTALEVAELDLGRTELVVLSACETGLGEEAGGEGLLGLQRAFQAAGARTTVTSLWSVPDEPTKLLMERLYGNLWRDKDALGRLAALREAQLWLLREGRTQSGLKRGLEREDVPQPLKDGRLPPYYWAAFVLAGDWR